jgi:hypothetical protein
MKTASSSPTPRCHEAHWTGRLTAVDFREITPLLWDHISPHRRYELVMTTRLALNE